MILSGIGCSLLDILYTRVDFSGPAFQRRLSKLPGDGGLVPGELVFTKDLEKFSVETYSNILRDITDGHEPSAINIGGPAIVALINVAQMVGAQGTVNYFGFMGDDKLSDLLLEKLSWTPLVTDGYLQKKGRTPSTDVLSDPHYGNDRGERTFICTKGIADNFCENDIPAKFYSSDIVLLGATAMVPKLHNELSSVLEKVKKRGTITVVTTVFDFLNEQLSPGKQWPLGTNHNSLKLIDLLICDEVEALKISGKKNRAESIEYFIKNGVGAVVVTSGINDVLFSSNGKLFGNVQNGKLPVCSAIDSDIEERGSIGDTTGCGDNFAGGVVSYLLETLSKNKALDFYEAIAWGTVTGGFARFYPGGVYLETTPGEKRESVEHYLEIYKKEVLSKLTTHS